MCENELYGQLKKKIFMKNKLENRSFVKKPFFALVLLFFIIIIPQTVLAGDMHALVMNGRRYVTKSAANSVKFTTDKKTLYVGQTYILKLSKKISGVKYVSSNKKIATVNKKGKVTAKKSGTAIITASVKGKRATCKITVKNVGIKLNKSSATIYTTGTTTVQLNATVTGSSKKVTWKSSNSSVASVNSSGKVTAKKAGTATITATANGKTAKCKINVKAGTKWKVGDTVTFGSYKQGKGSFIRDDVFLTQDIEWIVCSIDGDEAMLVSDKILDCMPYNDSDSSCTWKTCSLRKWLNNSFLNKAFTKSERKKIIKKEVSDNGSAGYNRENFNSKSTEDYVSLLSVQGFFYYEYPSVVYNGFPTEYAEYKGCSIGNAKYWVRQYYFNSAAWFACGYSTGFDDMQSKLGVRPVIWVKM